MIFQLIGDYEFTACTYLAGDETPGNDCSNKTVTNHPPAYCDTVIQMALMTGSTNVLSRNINNTTVLMANGYGDYTSMVDTVAPGNRYDISIEVTGNAWYMRKNIQRWVDWNHELGLHDPGEE